MISMTCVTFSTTLTLNLFLFFVTLPFSFSLKEFPQFAYLHAPFTPFIDDPENNYPLDLEVIPSLAKTAANNGVNLVWIGGGMGQFDTMTVNERNLLASAWVNATKSQNLNIYLVYHVGSTVQQDSIAMAKHGSDIGVSAIGSVPPYYEHCSTTDFSQLFDFFTPIIEASNNLPFFYYHIPGSTGYEINIYNFIDAAITKNGLPQLKGIKYVDNSNPMDYFNTCRDYKNEVAMMFAVNPKVQWFGLNMGNGTVLAEDFYSPAMHCMIKQFWDYNNPEEARRLVTWWENMDSFFSSYGSNAKRCLYLSENWAGVDIGPYRPPSLNTANCDDVIEGLNNMGFWDDIQSQLDCKDVTI